MRQMENFCLFLNHLMILMTLLNWSWRKKHWILAVLAFCAVTPDLASAWGVPLIVPQSIDWNISTTDAGRSLSGNVFCLGVGGIVAVPLSQRYGRLPVLFWSMFCTMLLTIGLCLCPNWVPYIAVRCLQGFFCTSPQVIGLSMIHDMFFWHEHARCINIWAFCYIMGPYLGPLLAGVIVNYISWRDTNWILFAIFGLATILTLTADESLYDRQRINEQPPKPKGFFNYKIQSLTGVVGARAVGRPTIAVSFWHILIIWSRPYFICIFVFYMLQFMWAVGINQTLVLFLYPPPPAGYGFSALDGGLIYIAPIIATVIGELFGHWFNDKIANDYLRKHKGVYEPEVRLWMTYISTFAVCIGLVILGCALQYHTSLHWMAVAMGWSIYVFGALTGTVSISAYALDCFPGHAAAASALINFARIAGGFIGKRAVFWSRCFYWV